MTRRLVWTALALVIIALVVLLLIAPGWAYQWPWTGFGGFSTRPNIQRQKTLWDWMQLIVVPLALAIFGVWLNQRQKARDDRQREGERELAEDRQHEDTLQAYLDRMAGLLLTEKLGESEAESTVRHVARARTLATSRALDPYRKGSVVQFLHEAHLIDADNPIIDLARADLRKAHLREAKLVGVNLHKADLREADLLWANLSESQLEEANLHDSNLSKANMHKAMLHKADLSKARVYGAVLVQADLSEAFLDGANLRTANLEYANLSRAICRNVDMSKCILRNAQLNQTVLDKADISGTDSRDADFGDAMLPDADLRGSLLTGADLHGAFLNGALFTQEQLVQVKSLKGATMADGSEHD